MKTFEQKFKELVPKDKETKEFQNNIIEVLDGEPDNDWKTEYENFIQMFPDSVPEKKKLTVKKTPAKPLVKKDEKTKSDIKKIKEQKQKAETKKAEEKAKKTKAEKEAEIQAKIASEKKEIEKQLTKIYNDFNSADPIKKMELAVTRAGVFKVKEKTKKKKPEEKAKRYGERMQTEHDKLISSRAGKVVRPALVELSKTKERKKENEALIKAAEDLNNVMVVISSDIDDHLMQKNKTEVEHIVKGFKALVIAAVSHENLTEKYKARPKALKALENLGFVTVTKDKRGNVSEIKIAAKIKPEVDKIRKSISKITEAVKFAKGGKINKRKFMSGGSVSDDVRIYVSDIAAYNEGKLIGEWIDFSDYNSGDEIMDAINDLLKKWSKEQGVKREEYAIHDAEGIPANLYSEYMGEETFYKIYDLINESEKLGLPIDVLITWAEETGSDPSRAEYTYYGEYKDEEDFAYILKEDVGLSNPQYYMYVDETTRRISADEEAEFRLSNMSEDDILNEAGLDSVLADIETATEEYEELDDKEGETEDEFIERKTGYKGINELVKEAKENLRQTYYQEWYDGLEDPYDFLVKEQGLYSEEDILKANWISFDYDKLAKDLSYDFNFIQGNDGNLYVFSKNYAKGGKITGTVYQFKIKEKGKDWENTKVAKEKLIKSRENAVQYAKDLAYEKNAEVRMNEKNRVQGHYFSPEQ